MAIVKHLDVAFHAFAEISLTYRSEGLTGLNGHGLGYTYYYICTCAHASIVVVVGRCSGG